MPGLLRRFRSPASWLRRPRRTARLRLTALYGGLILVSGAALVGVTYGLFERATEYTKPRLSQIPHTPAIQVLQFPAAKGAASTMPPGFAKQLPTALSQLAQAQYQLGQSQRQLLGANHPALQLPQLAQDQHQLTQDQHQLTQAVNQLTLAVHQVAQAGTVQAAQRAADSHQLLVNSAVALAIVAVLALGAGWLVAGRILRPIRTIIHTARRISSASLHERLALDGPPDELKELGDTLDDLFGRLDAAFDAQRHFVAHASHEMRTPLTADRNLLQVALDDPHTSAATWRSTAQEVLASNDEQKHLIEALLVLASSESGPDHRERTDLDEICQTVLARRAVDADILGLHIDTCIQPAPLDGDPTLIERLVTNLVDNAIGHNVSGGSVHISTEAAGGNAVMSVTNTGPIIPPGEIDRLFQPFQRLDPRRTHHQNGHGLGLSIVKAIAVSHCATITANPLPDGGLSVTVAFPPASSPVTTGAKKVSRTRGLLAHG